MSDLAGLKAIAEAKQVVVVHSVEAMAAARSMLPQAIAVTTWKGDTIEDLTDARWDALTGLHVVLWPENTDTGLAAMAEIGKRVYPDAESLKIVLGVERTPENLSAATLPHQDFDMLAWIRDYVTEWAEPESEELIPAQPTPKRKSTKADTWKPADQVKAVRLENLPFDVLGQSDGRVFFLKHEDGRMLNLAFGQIPKRECLGSLARSDVWQDAFGGEMSNPDGPPRQKSWQMIGAAAQDHIMQIVEKLPEFNPNQSRGRGCWRHGDTVAFNYGDRVQIGTKVTTKNYVDGVVYERGWPINVDTDNKLSNDEGRELLRLIGECSWLEGQSDVVLAGWIALAPICGALTWRPHVWVTGPSGSGKSTVMDDIIRPAIGYDMAVRFAGNTTEGGLRQVLRLDSLPVLLDEIEPKAKNFNQTMSPLLDLARSASSGDTIVRGTPHGAAKFYHIRSAFCLASVDISIAKAADESRFTMLRLRPTRGPQANERFQEMMGGLKTLIDSDFGSRLHARMIRIAPTVLETIVTMEDAITARFGSRRLAQQWGALLAGAHCLRSVKPITEEEATSMAGLVPDGVAKTQLEDDDAHAMLTHFTTYQLDMAATKGGRQRVTVGELIDRIASYVPIEEAAQFQRDETNDLLGRWGIKVADISHAGSSRRMVFVALKHPQLVNTLFRDTAWQNSYTDRFRDLDGAAAGPQKRFANTRCSSTMIPLKHFVDE